MEASILDDVEDNATTAVPIAFEILIEHASLPVGEHIIEVQLGDGQAFSLPFYHILTGLGMSAGLDDSEGFVLISIIAGLIAIGVATLAASQASVEEDFSEPKTQANIITDTDEEVMIADIVDGVIEETGSRG